MGPCGQKPDNQNASRPRAKIKSVRVRSSEPQLAPERDAQACHVNGGNQQGTSQNKVQDRGQNNFPSGHTPSFRLLRTDDTRVAEFERLNVAENHQGARNFAE
jgi:hypothetical protein